MNSRISFVAAGFLMVLILAMPAPMAAQPSPDAERLFQEAIMKKDVEGDLMAAIGILERIISDHSDARAVCAKAQLQIGMCYEKLGLQEAEKAYQNVLENYPEQSDVVSLAREKLSAIRSAKETVGSGKSEFVLQKAWPLADDNLGSPSPDGRFISYIMWSRMDPQLGLYEVATGKKTGLSATAGTWERDQKWPESSIWSPDGKQLAYVWYDRSKDDSGRSAPIAIRTIAIDGSEPRELFADEKVNYPHPFQWSSDGKHILAWLYREDHQQEMVLISVADRSVRRLKQWSGTNQAGMSLSPDGKHVAYGLSPNMDSPQTDISLLSTEGNGDTVIVKHPATDFAPSWSPNGKRIVFFSNRSGHVGLWALDIEDGRASGEPVLIKDNLNRPHPMGLTRDGHLYVNFYELETNVYSAMIDPVSGEVVSPPRRIVESHLGWNYANSYSQDGNFMSFVSRRGVLSVYQWGQESLIIRDLRSGDERELIPESRQLCGPIHAPQWSPNGRAILFKGRDKIGVNGLYLVDVGTAEVAPVIHRVEDGLPLVPIWGTDESRIYFVMRGSTTTNGVYVLDTGSKKATRLAEEDSPVRLSLHPDGKMLAVATNEAIKLLPVDGGETKELYRAERISQFVSLSWSPDGKWLYFTRNNQEKQVFEVWRVTADGGRTQDVGIAFPKITRMSLHPDGKRLAFTVVPRSNPLGDIWVMKNFLESD